MHSQRAGNKYLCSKTLLGTKGNNVFHHKNPGQCSDYTMVGQIYPPPPSFVIHHSKNPQKNLSKHCQIIAAFNDRHLNNNRIHTHTHIGTHTHTHCFLQLTFPDCIAYKDGLFFRKIIHNLTSFAFLRQCSCIHCKSIWKWFYLFLLAQLRQYEFIL